jgi:hypothetical protein
VGDYVELWDITLKKPYVARLRRIVQLPPHLEILPLIVVQWCCTKEDLPINITNAYGKHISVAEVFPTTSTFCLYVESIKAKCVVLTIDEYSEMAATPQHIHFSRSNYNEEKRELEPSPKEWKRLCSCDSPNNPDLQYVGCEKCENWFHVECVANYNEGEDFICEKCNLGLSDISDFTTV